jgi:DNA-binding GntR family transcriptional regulator
VVDQGEDDDGKRFASRRVADELKAKIEAGAYEVGTPLPPYRQIAAHHGVAVNTAMAAVRLLAEEGYVTSKPNAGSYVRDRTNRADPEQELRALRAELGELRSQVRQTGGQLAAIEARLSALSDVAARLEDLTRATRGLPAERR